MESGGSESGSTCCYYELLGIGRNASAADVRSAYRKLALKWHPDRWARDPKAAGEAKQRFQTIQEAYSVLSDDGKRAMYDAGFFDPLEEEEEDDPDFTGFMKEMLKMMDSVKSEKPATLEDLQRMLAEIAAGSDGCGGTKNREAQQRGQSEAPSKRARAATSSPRGGKQFRWGQ